MRIHHVSDSAVDRAQMYDALQAWIAALPGAPASVLPDGAVLKFESCDPGTAADVGSDSSGAALQLALTRTYVARDFYRSTGDQSASRCFAGKIVHKFTPEQLADPSASADDTSVQDKVRRFARDCL